MGTKQRIITEADHLFFTKGFKGLALQELGERLEIKPASLYYHFPGGKEQIYLEVIDLRVKEIQAHLEEIHQRHQSLSALLKSFGHWYAKQPPMNIVFIAEIDMPFLSTRGQKEVMHKVGTGLYGKLEEIFRSHSEHLRVDQDPSLLVGTFFALLCSIHASKRMGKLSLQQLVEFNVDLFLWGILRQEPNSARA